MIACGLADIVKSGAEPTIKDTGTEWDELPLIPVIVTTYVPGVAKDGTTTIKVEVIDPAGGIRTLLGLSVVEGPAGEGEADKNTVFEKPLMLPNVTNVVPEVPAAIVIELGLALMLKSTTLTVIVTE